ncbi:MAG: ABC transporter permease [Candidatus Dormibacteraeota bacterium]|nr:ABC transporter permease [Candidatus Dormibacteraeota bacterium]
MEILRNIGRRRLRSGLTILGIVIGIFALTTMGAMAEHFNALIGGGVTYYGSNIQVGSPAGQASLLPISKVQEIEKVQGVRRAFPAYYVPAKPGAAVISFGVPDFISYSDPSEEQYSVFKTSMAQGHQLDPASRGDVVLGTSIAAEFNKHVGDTIRLPVRPGDATRDFVNHPFKVVGILNATNTAPDSGAYVSQTDAQMLMAESLGPAVRSSIDTSKITSGIVVYGPAGASTAQLDTIAGRINQQVPGVKATRPTELVDNFKSGGAVFTAVTTAAAILALIIGGLSVVNTMIMAVTERRREIGLKKAVGAHTGNILREFLTEATLMGLIGGVLGYALGVGLTTLLNAAGQSANLAMFLITPALTAIAIGFAVALGALAGVIPALRAARMDPVQALRTTN